MLPEYPNQQALKQYEAFVIDIVSYLIDDFDGVAISSQADDRGILITLSVPEQHLGRLIGKQGSTIESIKTLLRCYGSKNQMGLGLKLVPAE